MLQCRIVAMPGGKDQQKNARARDLRRQIALKRAVCAQRMLHKRS